MQEELQTMLKECHLCPRNCGVARLAGQKGFCGVAAGIMVARAALHMWEEPCISGKEGSGAVFFQAVLWDVRSVRIGRFPKGRAVR